MIYLLIICIIIIGFLGYKIYKREQVDATTLEEYKAELAKLKEDIFRDKNTLHAYETKLLDLQIKCNTERNHLNNTREQLDDCESRLKSAQASYDDLIGRRMKEINTTINEQWQQQQKQLEKNYNESKAKYDMLLADIQRKTNDEIEQHKKEAELAAQGTQIAIANYSSMLREIKEKYEGLLAPIKQYEKEKQEKLFYTIQLPEEYHDDIEFLLTTVSAKVQHPDILSKLVWNEYVKPNIDETFKRVEIRSEPGIYKLTNLDSGKAYIGKSTDVKKRIADHFKSAVGCRAIADQAVHHEILKTGFWNWTIEVITYCDKDKLSELEKYYIDFFKTQEFGFNKNSGGGG